MVDLYCDQVGTPLSHGQSVSMYTGGCPTNIAVGASRQGLRVAMLTRVGDDDTGRFVIETLRREDIDTGHITVDPNARTPMVMAAMEPPDRFPLTWYRERAADLEVDVSDLDDALLGDTTAVLLSGNTLSRPHGAAAARHLIERCKALGTRVVYDIDFRPALWFTESPAIPDGASRYTTRAAVPPAEIAATLQSVLHGVDLLVGTEEEYVALMGIDDAAQAFDAARARIPGTAILKKGKDGAMVAPPNALAVSAGGFSVRVFNTLGAGDAFISGFLAGWLRDAPFEQCLARANASGAIVVTRHGCSPAMPYDAEIAHFLAHTAPAGLSPQDDPRLQRLHAAGSRPPKRRPLCVLAIDHRTWFEDVAGPGREADIAAFKHHAVSAARARFEREGWMHAFGVIIDSQFGESMLRALRRDDAVWLAEPIEVPGVFPLQVMGPGGDAGLGLRERPRGGAVKVLLACTTDTTVQARQVSLMQQLQAACNAWSRELLLELIPRECEVDIAACMHEMLDAGVTPDYWKLPLPATDAAWKAQRTAVERDPACHGVLFLGGAQPLDTLAEGLGRYVSDPLALGFAVGRTLFERPFRAHLAGAPEDLDALADELIRLARPWVEA